MSEELKHHGVKGMKWGVRRFQNSDGTLKKAGKTRARQNDNKTNIQKATDRVKSTAKSVAREHQAGKVLLKAESMSTKELKAAASRAQKELQYKQLTKPTNLGVATKEDRAQYRRRGEMSTRELNRKVERLQAKQNLKNSYTKATKTQVENGERVVAAAANTYLKAAAGTVGAAALAKVAVDGFANPKTVEVGKALVSVLESTRR